MSAVTVNSFLLSLGRPGCYQFISCVLLCTNVYPLICNNYATLFYGITPKHNCKGFYEGNESLVNNASESCFVSVDPLNESFGEVQCTEWEYDRNVKRKSIVAEWDLVCNHKWKLSLGSSIYFAGVTIGGILGGFLGDKFGRRPVILATIYTQTIIGIIITFIHNYVAFVALRFIQGIVVQTLSAASYTLMMELLQPRMRDIAGTCSNTVFTSGIGVIAAMAWVLDDWRHTQLVMTFLTLSSCFYFWFIPESMRWLIAHQRVDEAEVLARKIIKFNKIKGLGNVRVRIEKLSEDCAQRTTNSSNKKYNLIDLIRTKRIRKYSFICAFIWFTTSIVNYGVMFGLPSIASNIYLSVIIISSVQVSMFAVKFILLRKFGRRRLLVTIMTCCGILCLAIPFISHFGETYKTISTVVAGSGAVIIVFSWTVISVFTTELYPTVIRTNAIGCGIFFARVGGIIAPQIILLGNLYWKPIPFLICSACAVTSAVLVVFLPETHNKTMVEVIEDVENGSRDQENDQMLQ